MSPKPAICDPMNQPVNPPQNDVAGPNTDTADVAGTGAEVAALARAGSEMVRITVDRDEAAAAVPHIRDELRKRGITTPLIGDFHYIGHKLLADSKDVRAVTREAMVQSALLSAARAEEIGLPKNKMILSAKVSAVQDLI